MEHVKVVGLGKVGTLVVHFLSRSFRVTGVDLVKTRRSQALDIILEDVGTDSGLTNICRDTDAIVSCLPYHANLRVARACHEQGIHYFDLTEDVATTTEIRRLAESGSAVMIPQCGLAPGLIGIVGAHLMRQLTTVRKLQLRVGALPAYPDGYLGYSFNWSPAGVINQYTQDCEVIRDGRRKFVPPLQDQEQITLCGRELEAFTTSGGLGTLCESYESLLENLDYKTIRYPGHLHLMKFLLDELHLRRRKDILEEILTNAKPPVDDDVVYVYAAVEGRLDEGPMERIDIVEEFRPLEIDGVKWRAISWTTAAAVAAVVELVASGRLPGKGFIKQEEIMLTDLLSTKTGVFLKRLGTI